MLGKPKDGSGKLHGNGHGSEAWAAPEEHGLDLHQPRMIAAMKVTGIQPADLEVEHRPDSGGEKEMRRFEVKQKKRLNLIRELQEAADSLDTRDVDVLIRGPGHVDQQTIFLEEKAKIDRQRDRAREELQRKAAWEVEAQQAVIKSNKDYDILTKRINEQKEEQAKKNHTRMEEKRLKVETNVKAAKERQKQDRLRIAKLVQDKDENVVRNLEALKKKQASKIGEVQEKAEANQRRLDEHCEMEMETTLRKHYNNVSRMEKLEDWMHRRDWESHQKQVMHKLDSCDKHQKVMESLAAQAQEREKLATQNLKKLEKAREDAARNWLSLAESARAKRTQSVEKWKLNKQARVAETKKKKEQIVNQLNASGERSAQIVKEYQAATVGRYAGIREIFQELVQENKERLDRSDQTARDHRINKIWFEKAQNEAREDQLKQATGYRVEAFRERVAGQTQVEELQQLLTASHRSSPTSRCQSRANTERLHTILNELGVPIPAFGGETVNEDETKDGRGQGDAQGK